MLAIRLTECDANGVSLVPLDSDGWPLSIPSGDVARMVLGPIQRTAPMSCNAGQGKLPTGVGRYLK